MGRGIALAMAKQGAAICIAEIDPSTGKNTAAEIAELGVSAMAIECDASQPDQIESAVAAAVAELGRLDVLVNNATGASPESFRPVLEHTLEHWDRQLAVDVRGSFVAMKSCFPHLRASGAGRVISICSLAGSERSWGFAAYAAAKEALRALTGVVAREWGEHGITANVICPTAITPSTAGYMERHPEVADQQLASVALGRHGEPEADIGRVAAFLASEAAGYVTGQTLWVDGGAVIHA